MRNITTDEVEVSDDDLTREEAEQILEFESRNGKLSDAVGGRASFPGAKSGEPMQSLKTKAGMSSAIVNTVAGMDKLTLAKVLNFVNSTGASGEKVSPMQKNSKISQPARVTKEDIDVTDDIAAMFSDASDISDEFKEKAADIFHTAVVAIVNEKLKELGENAESDLETTTDQISEDLVTKVDSYLDYVVEQWMEQNKLAIASGIRNEISESFMLGLKKVFEEHYVNIPEDSVDVVDQLGTKNDNLESALNAEISDTVELRKEIEAWKRATIIKEHSEGLSDLQSEKLAKLAEATTYSSDEDFNDRIQNLKESYFDNNRSSTKSMANRMLDEETHNGDDQEEEKVVPVNMRSYVAAIGRGVKK